MSEQTQRLFSGIRPTGKLHLGNYLGAIKNWISLQDEYDAIFGIVDLHGITTPYDPANRQNEIREMLLDYLAAGLDPQKATIVVQSHVREHLELSWILGSITPLSWLDRIPTFKEKKEKHPEYINLGLYSYPVLMSADILLYDSAVVPVGEDQVPHIELASDLAKRFNHQFGETFKQPKPLLSDGKRIMSLSDPTSKMSKSDGGGIALSDTPDEIRNKIKRAVTATDGDAPGVQNLLVLLKEFGNAGDVQQFSDQLADGSIRFSDLKDAVSTAVIDGLADFRAKREELAQQPDYLESVLTEGAQKASAIAEAKMSDVRAKCGL